MKMEPLVYFLITVDTRSTVTAARRKKACRAVEGSTESSGIFLVGGLRPWDKALGSIKWQDAWYGVVYPVAL